MLRVALTGGIATGKSYVRARIASRGVPTIDADLVVHDLFAPGTAISRAVGDRFGVEALDAAGGVNRRALGQRVFADERARRDLGTIVHPAVYLRIGEWMEECARLGPAWVVADIPLLFETGRADDFDQVLVTACGAEVQVARVMARDGLTEAAARARLAAQWPIDDKVARADRVIRTDGAFDDTDSQVDAACDWLDRVSSGAW